MAATFLAIAGCTIVCGQQVAFTSRIHLQSPVIVTSTQESKVYGFESVEIQSDSANPVRAVRLKVTFKTRAGEEITDERRFVVDMEARDKKRLTVDLGHIEGLRQKARSREQESGLAILTVAAVEFEDGSIWEDDGPVQGMPVQPAQIPRK
jgi:hypothetical protein